MTPPSGVEPRQHPREAHRAARPTSGSAGQSAPTRTDTASTTAATQAAVSASIHQAPAVGAHPDPVDHGDRPARVREPVDRAPRAVAEPAAQHAGQQHRQQQVERHRSEPEPQRAVCADERDHRVDQRDRDEPVDHARQDVQRPAARAPAATRRGAARRSRTAASARRPRTASSPSRRAPRWRSATAARPRRCCARDTNRRSRRSRPAPPASSCQIVVLLGPAGQVADGSVQVDQPAGQPQRAPATRRASSLRTIAAVLAMFASRQEPAATRDRAVDAGRGRARVRVDQVVGEAVVVLPAAGGRARGGQPARAQRDPLARARRRPSGGRR